MRNAGPPQLQCRHLDSSHCLRPFRPSLNPNEAVFLPDQCSAFNISLVGKSIAQACGLQIKGNNRLLHAYVPNIAHQRAACTAFNVC